MEEKDHDMPEKRLRVDFCVVGGGLAGMAAAIDSGRPGGLVGFFPHLPPTWW